MSAITWQLPLKLSVMSCCADVRMSCSADSVVCWPLSGHHESIHSGPNWEFFLLCELFPAVWYKFYKNCKISGSDSPKIIWICPCGKTAYDRWNISFQKARLISCWSSLPCLLVSGSLPDPGCRDLLPFSHRSVSEVRHWCWLIMTGWVAGRGSTQWKSQLQAY